MPALKNPRHEAFAQALARCVSAAAAYGQVGFKPHRANAATLARKEHISVRVAELQEEQLSIHKQATAEAVANAKVTIESLIAERADREGQAGRHAFEGAYFARHLEQARQQRRIGHVAERLDRFRC